MSASQYGDEIINDFFGNRQVWIYSNGYVRVSRAFGLGGGSAPYEKLISIEDSSDLQKKSAAGRGVGFLLTGGVSLFLPNMRGDMYLAIVTNDQTHMLHEDPPTERGVKAAKKLAATGRAVINSADNRAVETPAPPSAPEPQPRFEGVLLEISTENASYHLQEHPSTTAGEQAAERLELVALAEIDGPKHESRTPGGLALSATFAGHSIVIYKGGFIKVRELPIAGGSKPVPERLVSIERREISDSANADSPDGGTREDTTGDLDTNTSAGSRLRELNSLKDDGLLSDEEYEQLRKRVIDAL